MKQFESFGLDTKNECLWRDGKQIALPPKPFAVLRYLVENPGRLISHDELLDALWPETYVQPQVLRTYMLDLRKVLGDDAGQPRFIQTLPKRGYCFVAAVKDATEASATTSSTREPRLRDIVGRDDELAELLAHVDSAVRGKRQVVFVTGEAGIGKTALVEAFCRRVSESQAIRLAVGQCVEGFAAREEYYPVLEALGQLCASPAGEEACRILSRVSPAWLATPRSHSSPAHERMAGDLCSALDELAAQTPLVLVFEDLNWADHATLHLLSALARRRAPARLMVLATYRAHTVATEHPLKALKQDLKMKKLCCEMALAPLPKAALRALLSRELQQEEPPSGLTSFIHQHSEGNPLFALAILEHLIAQRFLIRDKTSDGAPWKQRAPFQEMEAGVPDGLAQMIELEIDRLSAQEQRILEAGSLTNIAFPAWAVAAALEEDPAEVEDACDALAHRLYFLERGGEDELPDGTRSAFYVFAHGLFREVLYQRQPAARRAKRHTHIADRLGQLFTGRTANVEREIAFHYEAAGNWQRAIGALLAAARHALARQANAEATELLEHALRLVENVQDEDRQAAAEEIRNELLTVRESVLS